MRYDDYKPFIDVNTPSLIAVPIPDPKPLYPSVKPKVESSVIREVLCRKKRAGLADGTTSLSMELTDDQVLGQVSQDERLLIDFIINCLQLKPWKRLTCEKAL